MPSAAPGGDSRGEGESASRGVDRPVWRPPSCRPGSSTCPNSLPSASGLERPGTEQVSPSHTRDTTSFLSQDTELLDLRETIDFLKKKNSEAQAVIQGALNASEATPKGRPSGHEAGLERGLLQDFSPRQVSRRWGPSDGQRGAAGHDPTTPEGEGEERVLTSDLNDCRRQSLT